MKEPYRPFYCFESMERLRDVEKRRAGRRRFGLLLAVLLAVLLALVALLVFWPYLFQL